MKNLKLLITYCTGSPIFWLTGLCALTGTILFLTYYDSLLPGSASYLLTANSHITIWHWQWKVLVAIGVATLWLLGLFWSFNHWKSSRIVLIIFHCCTLMLVSCERQTKAYISSICTIPSSDTIRYPVDIGIDGDGKVDEYVFCKSAQELHSDSFRCGEIVYLDKDSNGILFINPEKSDGFICSDYTGHFCQSCSK